MLVCPSDHKIIDWEIFQECIYQGFEFIKKGKILHLELNQTDLKQHLVIWRFQIQKLTLYKR